MEYAALHRDPKSATQGAQAEGGLLYQPIDEAGGSGDEELGGARRFFVGAAGHGTPAPKHGHHGSANEGSACGLRNGCGGGPENPDKDSECTAAALAAGAFNVWLGAAVGWVCTKVMPGH
jgi:hypothetical protein